MVTDAHMERQDKGSRSIGVRGKEGDADAEQKNEMIVVIHTGGHVFVVHSLIQCSSPRSLSASHLQ